MEENRLKIEELERKLHELISRQQSFLQECTSIKAEINRLKNASSSVKNDVAASASKTETCSVPASPIIVSTPSQVTPERKPLQPSKSNLEKFIGENLINKVGIIITILGVGWGVKYSIDNQLISPTTRMILGYLFSSGLLGLSFYLKKRYENYSAVLLSGSMAMMYFITYFAHSSYGIIGKFPAFGLMVLFTIYTVAESLRYNRSVIAHIGLVGAYAVPFLLSDGSGKVVILFTYMAIINMGILFIAFKRYWKSLYYSAFAFTWLICIGWMITSYQAALSTAGLGFLSFFFVLFITAMLAYKIYRKEAYVRTDTLMISLNTIFYYILCLFIADRFDNGPFIFTCLLIAFHAALAFVLSKRKDVDSKLVHHIYGLAIALLVVVIPIKLNNEWVTISWSILALALVWIASTKKINSFRNLFQAVIAIAFISLLHDWSLHYSIDWSGRASNIFPSVLNSHFASSLVVALLFAACAYILFVRNKNIAEQKNTWLTSLVRITTSFFVLIALYGTFYHEINHYWMQMRLGINDTIYENISAQTDKMFIHFRSVWIINYTLVFGAFVFLVLQRLSKSKSILTASYVSSNLIMLVFLSVGLLNLSWLRLDYMKPLPYASDWNLYIRYFSFAYASLLIWTCYRHARQSENKAQTIKAFDFLLHITCLWALSAELLHWRELLGSSAADKTGLSILWGAYSLMLIVVGILQKKSYLRIAAMVWLGITLIKLFFYDLSELSTLSKTVVLVILGVVLLIISFLYNKYKAKIFGDEE